MSISTMSLSGRHLKVAADIWVPWVDLREAAKEEGGRGLGGLTLTASGVAAEFFDMIATKLNFTYALVMPPDREWGRGMPNGSFTGMIGMCQRKEVDMALGPFGVTWERAQVVDFSSTLYMDGFGIFLPRPRLERDLAGFTKPLAWQVKPSSMVGMEPSVHIRHRQHLLKFLKNYMTSWSWCRYCGKRMIILPFAPCFVLPVFLQIPPSLTSLGSRRFLSPAGNPEITVPADRPRYTTRARDGHLFEAFPYIWFAQAVLRQPISVLPRAAAGRVFLGTWMVATIVLSSAYKGVLTSLLAVPMVTVPVDSLEDLVNHGKIPWANERGTSLHQLFSDAESGLYKMVNDGGSLVVNAYQARHRIKEERMAVLCDFFTMRKIMSDDFGRTGECHYYIAAEPIKSAPLAFAFPRGSPLTPHFNRWMAPLKESGLVSRSVLELTSNATACLVAPGKEGGLGSTLVLTLSDLAGVFLLFVGGLVLGVLIWTLEALLSYKNLLDEKLELTST
ncbi:probable glutamate receptor [Panulirus ornatus]|uniref:probable glutamate receptor n=1 Tax=Panulirus ornatus TaxID=150431 RepID=UPI003A88FE0F